MKQSKNILTLSLSIIALMATGVVAYAQSSSCQTTYPECEDSITMIEDTLCGGSDYWEVSDPMQYFYYVCNNWYSGCGGTGPHPPNCNVMVRYEGVGRTIYCPYTGQTTFCMESINTGGHVNLNENCAGGPCSVPGGVTDNSTTYPPNYENSTWEALPNRPSIPE